MRIISIIEDQEPVVSLKVERVIDKILGHLGLWQTNQRPPPKPPELQLDYSDSQLPGCEDALDAESNFLSEANQESEKEAATQDKGEGEGRWKQKKDRNISKLGRLNWGSWPPGFPGQKQPIGIWLGPEAVPPK